MSDKELKELIAETFRGIKELKESQVKTDAQLAKTSEELGASQAKTDAQLAKTDAKLAKVAEMLGNIGNNQGDVAEEFFYNSLADKHSLAGIKYDFVDHNWRGRVGHVVDEFDIVMVNGQDIALIEVKYKAHEKDLEKLLTKKMDNFRILYPVYASYTLHPALAAFYIHDDLKEQALEAGVVVIQRKGDTIETFCKAG